MADKSYPPTKPNPPPPFNRPIYRPQPPPPSKSRSCCFSVILLLLSLILLAFIAGGIFYAVYRPHTPSFSISSLRLSSLNSTSRLLDITVTARNPNRRISYSYDQISLSISSDGVGIGETSFPGFVHSAKNTMLMSSKASAALDLKKSAVSLEFYMETKAEIKVGRLRTKKVGMRVYCDGMDIAVPKGKKAPPASNVDRRCKVKLRMKIWKWTI